MILTHSSYWLERNQVQHSEKLKADKQDTGKDTATKTEGTEVRRLIYCNRNVSLFL
jgi:hypothetical protein